MKPVLAVITVCLLAAENLPAQYYGAIQQARRDSAQNDAEQRRIQNEAGGAPQSAAPGAPAQPAPVDPALQVTLKNITGLRADFAAVVATDKADPAQKIALLNDLTQAAQGTSKATSNSVKKLADDLTTALAGQKKLAAATQQKLAQEIHALFNSARLTPAQQKSLPSDIQKLLTDGGVSLDSAVDVVTDLKEIVAETK
jgi:hypothetical protein